MPIINRIPRGFLNLLGSQVGGRTPAESADIVQPVVDTTPFYLGDRMSFETVVTAPAGLGQQTAISVPADQFWLLYGISVAQTVVLAADTATYSIQCNNLPNQPASGLFNLFRLSMVGTGLAFPQQMGDGVIFGQPIPCQAGVTFLFRLEEATNFNGATISLMIARLEG